MGLCISSKKFESLTFVRQNVKFTAEFPEFPSVGCPKNWQEVQKYFALITNNNEKENFMRPVLTHLWQRKTTKKQVRK